MSFWKHLPALAIGAAVSVAAGAAAYFITHRKEEQEHIVGPEDEVKTDPAAEPEADAPAEAPAQPEETPVQEPAVAEDNGPNANPVALGAVEVPRTEDGKLDVTQIAQPEDFADWSDVGCQG